MFGPAPNIRRERFGRVYYENEQPYSAEPSQELIHCGYWHVFNAKTTLNLQATFLDETIYNDKFNTDSQGSDLVAQATSSDSQLFGGPRLVA